MKKTLFTICGVSSIIFLGLIVSGIIELRPAVQEHPGTSSYTVDAKNTSYVIDDEAFMLVNGVAEKEIAPGFATKDMLSLFQEPIYGDLNGDGLSDAVALLVRNSGGSGTFYYASFVMNENNESKSTNAILLGDRIAPQTIAIQDEYAIYNYAERGVNEPMTTPPSIGKSLYVKYNSDTRTISEFQK